MTTKMKATITDADDGKRRILTTTKANDGKRRILKTTKADEDSVV
jgi:hypothetical protein